MAGTSENYFEDIPLIDQQLAELGFTGGQADLIFSAIRAAKAAEELIENRDKAARSALGQQINLSIKVRNGRTVYQPAVSKAKHARQSWESTTDATVDAMRYLAGHIPALEVIAAYDTESRGF
jgi:hypothetical protein